MDVTFIAPCSCVMIKHCRFNCRNTGSVLTVGLVYVLGCVICLNLWYNLGHNPLEMFLIQIFSFLLAYLSALLRCIVSSENLSQGEATGVWALIWSESHMHVMHVKICLYLSTLNKGFYVVKPKNDWNLKTSTLLASSHYIEPMYIYSFMLQTGVRPELLEEGCWACERGDKSEEQRLKYTD